MSVITKVPQPNLWDEICKEFSSRQDLFAEDDNASVATDYQDFDPAKHNPVFYGQMFHPVSVDADPVAGVDPAVIHPSVIGYAFADKPPKAPDSPPPPIPTKNECTPREYLEHYIFPVLLPALEKMLKQAKTEKCFERKRTKFDALDFLTAFLYNNNPNKTDREQKNLEEIPFVKEWLTDHPRPPLPLSLIWTEEEAAVKIQSFWRGYLVRREPNINELVKWQLQWREENRGIQTRVTDFWEKKMPDQKDPQNENENIDILSVESSKKVS